MRLSEAERRRRLQKMLEQVAPESNVQHMREDLQSATAESLETLSVGVAGQSATESLDVLVQRGMDEVSPAQVESLEAIVHKRYRPAVFVVNDTYEDPPAPWEALAKPQVKARVSGLIPSIGRIELPGNTTIPYGGTGFVVGPGLVMTNRHVAEFFAERNDTNQLVFKSGLSAAINFRREVVPSPNVGNLTLRKIVMIHPYWDMALLQVEGLSSVQSALPLSTTHVDDLRDRDVVVIGYPAQDDRSEVELQNRIFRGVFDVKRLLPGKLRERRKFESYENLVDAATHDASTLGGSSGSAVIDADTGQVIALHFAGRYLDANFAVPMFELASDNQVVDAGVEFMSGESSAVGGSASGSNDVMDSQSTGNSKGDDCIIDLRASGSVGECTIPLHVTLRVGLPVQEPEKVSAIGISKRAMGDLASSESTCREGQTALNVPTGIGTPEDQHEANKIKSAVDAPEDSMQTDQKTPDQNVARETGSARRFLTLPALSEVRSALDPRCNEQELKARVWYIEAYFGDEIQQGTGVLIRVTNRQTRTTRNVLLTCKHVVQNGEQEADLIRCWPHASGYNPGTKERMWRGEPARINQQATSAGFVADGSLDWVLLNVAKEGESFDSISDYVPGFASKKLELQQRVSPYRLVGFPGGSGTMPRDVVRATVSRDYRLSETDAKTGQIVLKGPEDSAPGFSGGPYFNSRGQLVAIHRSRGPGMMPIGVNAHTVETTLNDNLWQVVAEHPKRLQRLTIRLVALLAVLCVGAVAWELLRPGPEIVYGVEGQIVKQPFKTRRARLVDSGNASDASISKDGVFTYSAKDFSSYVKKDGYIATDRLHYCRDFLGLPMPMAEIKVKVRQHMKLNNIDELYETLSKGDNKRIWQEEATRPVFTIDSIEVGPSTKDDFVMQTSHDVKFVQAASESDNKPKIQLILHLGKHSPLKNRNSYLYKANTKTHVFSPRHVFIRSDEEYEPSFESEWKLNLHPALTVDGSVITSTALP